MKRSITFLLILISLTSFSQEKYFVNAPNGLIVRAEPRANADKVGEVLYGAIVEVLNTSEDQIEITDEGRKIKGSFSQIKYSDNTLFGKPVDSFDTQNGYVFNGYLEKLNKATITTESIYKLQFDSCNVFEEKKLLAITDVSKIKEMLGDRIIWVSHDDNDDIRSVGSVQLDNGKIVNVRDETGDVELIAFYPKDRILLFMDIASSEHSISLRTGETLATVGNPEYVKISPNEKYRLNGHFLDQECCRYFFQEIDGESLIYLVDFGRDLKYGSKICCLKDFIWISGEEFAYSFLTYDSKWDNPTMKYVKGKLQMNDAEK